MKNTNVILVGTVVSKMEFSHMVLGEAFYTFKIEVERLSGTKDIIPIMVSSFVLKKYCRNY